MDFQDDMPASFSYVETYDDENLPATQLLCPFDEKDSDINNPSFVQKSSFFQKNPLSWKYAIFSKKTLFSTKPTFSKNTSF